MREITNESINAFLSNTKYKKSNTEIKVLHNRTFLYLWKSKIVFKANDGTLYINLCKFNTNTTRDRLNGLPSVHIRYAKRCLTLNGEEWNNGLTIIKE